MRHDPQKWKSEYDRDGYVVIHDVVGPELLATLRQGIERITANPRALPPELLRHIDFERNVMVRRPGFTELTADQVGDAIVNIMELPQFGPEFAELIVYPPVLDVLEALFGSTEFGFHNYKCIVKSPRISSRFMWHRDLPFLEHSTPNLITAMICLDAMTEANGATVVIPGSHRVPHDSITPADKNIPEEKVPGGRVTVCCPAGSLVLFHVNILHGGGANRSEFPRRNVISIWAGPDAYPTTSYRYAYHDLKPRSSDQARRRQVQMTFPRLAAGK